MQISWDINSRIQRSAFMSSKKSVQKCFDPYERIRKTRKKWNQNEIPIARFVAGTPRNKSEHLPEQAKSHKTKISHENFFQLSSPIRTHPTSKTPG